MKIDKITIDNFQESFNLLDILTDSVFYPASGIDAIDIEQFSLECFSKNFFTKKFNVFGNFFIGFI